MTVTTTTDALVDLDVDLLLIPLTSEPGAPLIDTLASTLGTAIRRAAEDFAGTAGDTVLVYPEQAAATRVALVGMGPPEELGADQDAETLRRAAAGGAKTAGDKEADSVACMLPAVDVNDGIVAQAVVEGFVLGSYRYRRYKTADGFGGPSAFTVHLGDDVDAGAVRDGVETGRALASGTCTARDLVNTSPNDKTARRFAETIQASGAEHGYDVETWDEDRIREEGFGGLLAVNQGSFEPPTVSVLEWTPDNAVNDRPIVLAGKGVVFDTGGLSLKDTKGSMDMMKSDMGGAAAVVGAFEALADLNTPLHVIGLVPATDNRPGRNAYVPGDVITMHSGATVEVMNTDAEGRLLLADALSYAKNYDPKLVVDLATLTGAQVVALGSNAAAVMTSETDDAAERLYAIQRAGERSGERVHPLPMYDEYRQQLDSAVADLQNVGGKEAGAVTAGKFLEHFTGDYPWLHLDVAGPAFLNSEKPYRPKGGTGFGVRLLLTYLNDYVTTRKKG
jgi:leucyl aminopeptidase